MDVPVVTFFCAVAKSEQPVIDQQQPFHIGIFLIRLGRSFGECETGHDVSDDTDPVAINFLAHFLCVRLIGDDQTGIRMRMVDELMRQECVQKRLHRRVGGGRIQQMRSLLIDHFLIAQPIQASQFLQIAQQDAGKARRLQCIQIPATALNIKHIHLFVHLVAGARLD